MVTLHARVADLAASEQVTLAIGARLRERYGVDHVTVQIECATCADGAGRKATPARAPGASPATPDGPAQQGRGEQERRAGQMPGGAGGDGAGERLS